MRIPLSSANTRKALFYLLSVLFSLAVCVALVAAYLYYGKAPMTVAQLSTQLSAQDKEAVYRFLRNEVGGVYDVIPQPDVARLLQSNISKPFGGVEVVSNNAGMRAERPYGPKPEGMFRIVMLGDSFVFGHEAPQADRVGDQIEATLKTQGVLPKGKRPEVLTLGLPSWTSVNEAAYLSARITAYAPDLVIVLMVSNDLDDTQAVSGVGTISNAFSPDTRELGSVFFTVYQPILLGVQSHGLLNSDIGTESRQRWERAFSYFKRLERLLDARNAKLLFSAFDEAGSDEGYAISQWRDLIVHYHRQAGLDSPILFVNPYLEADTKVRTHPNRKGHAFLANHYLHALAKLGWLPLAASNLPPLHPEQDLTLYHEPNPADLARKRKAIITRYLHTSIDFRRQSEPTIFSILGGISRVGENGKHLAGSRKAVFLLRRDPKAQRIEVNIQVPAQIELYPFRLALYLNDKPAASLELETPKQAGLHTLAANLPPYDPDNPAVEVRLETMAFWTGIDYHSMFSYFLDSARQVP